MMSYFMIMTSFTRTIDEMEGSKITTNKDMDEYDVWLSDQKKKWRSQLDARKKQTRMFGLSNTFTSSFQGLEIIQIAETDTLGEYILWGLVDRINLHPIRLKIPRKFFLNTRVANQQHQQGVKKSMANLPRSKPRWNLYEYNFEELDYRLNSKVIIIIIIIIITSSVLHYDHYH